MLCWVIRNRQCVAPPVPRGSLFNCIGHGVSNVLLVAPFPLEWLLFSIRFEKLQHRAKAPVALPLSVFLGVKVDADAEIGGLLAEQNPLQELRGTKMRTAIGPPDKKNVAGPPPTAQPSPAGDRSPLRFFKVIERQKPEENVNKRYGIMVEVAPFFPIFTRALIRLQCANRLPCEAPRSSRALAQRRALRSGERILRARRRRLGPRR